MMMNNILTMKSCEVKESLKCLKILENFLIPTYIRDVNYNIYGGFGDDIEQTGLIEYFEAEVN